MTLPAGTRLGPYEILSPLGAGGMGEVYRASDAKLKREVAIKVLPEAVAQDHERLARFEREAQVLASLNHPNIGTIYGVEDSGGAPALVMELVEGPTLEDRIAQGPIPVEEALPIAREIAEGLDYAHERGIIHRDLKPANIKLTADGKVKILDFGLAKALDPVAGASSPDVTRSPTITAMATQARVILGTAAYMSPEQARGRPADKRSDIWAFGCVLWEMLTGKRLFHGETVSDTLAAVLRADIEWGSLPAGTPPALRGLLERCLERDPRRRLRDIGEARIAMEGAPASFVGAPPDTAAATAARRVGLGRMAVSAVAGGVLVAVLAAGFGAMRRGRSAENSAVRLSLILPPGQAMVVEDLPNLALSRDGAEIAYVAKKLTAAAPLVQPPEGLFQTGTSGRSALYLRSMGSFDAKELPESEGARTPSFSSDGQWLGYIVGGRVLKMAVSGGAPQPVCDTSVSSARGVAWAEDGSILVLSENGSLLRGVQPGGRCEEIVKPDAARGVLLDAESLPGGEGILFASLGGFQTSQAHIAVLDLKTGKSRVIISQGTNPRYVEPGFIVFGRAGSILAAPFDPHALKLLGQPVPVVEGVLPDPISGIEQFAVSRSGVLAYLAGVRTAVKRRLVMADRKGVSTTATADANSFEDLSLSPDGREVALTVEGPSWNIWVYHLDRKTLTRLTFENDNRDPIWTPDGKRVVYTSLRSGLYGLYWRPADGSGAEERLFNSNNWVFASSWSPDGRFLAFVEQDPKTGMDLRILPVGGDRKPYPFVNTSFREWFGEFSRDGRWIAYESNESGRSEIYLRPFPGPGGKWQVSTGGGARPEWSRDGRELFYFEGEKIMHVTVDSSHALAVGRPELLFPCNCFESGRYYDVTPDAQQFVLIQNAQPVSPVTQVNVVFGWGSEVDRQMREKPAR